MALSIAACNNVKKTMLPDSGGRPYEIVIVGDSDSILYKVMTEPLVGLPQTEPMFDANLHSTLNATLKLARNIALVEIKANTQRTTVRYERNVYAEPQLIAHIYSPSMRQLQHDMQHNSGAKGLRDLFAKNEIANAITNLEQKHNPKMEHEIKQMFGIDMLIPADMNASKKGKDFIWLSNNSPTAMTNICIYASTNRDSVMKANIKGETDAMYMKTTCGSVVTTRQTNDKDTTTIRRGLWEMYGDAMGGPFVQHIKKQGVDHKFIVAEVFVYAPGTKKRNLLLNTEAALYTIQPKQKR